MLYQIEDTERAIIRAALERCAATTNDSEYADTINSVVYCLAKGVILTPVEQLVAWIKQDGNTRAAASFLFYFLW